MAHPTFKKISSSFQLLNPKDTKTNSSKNEQKKVSLIVVKDYHAPTSSSGLSVTTGEVLTLLGESDSSECYLVSRGGTEGLVPKQCLEKKTVDLAGLAQIIGSPRGPSPQKSTHKAPPSPHKAPPSPHKAPPSPHKAPPSPHKPPPSPQKPSLSLSSSSAQKPSPTISNTTSPTKEILSSSTSSINISMSGSSGSGSGVSGSGGSGVSGSGGSGGSGSGSGSGSRSGGSLGPSTTSKSKKRPFLRKGSIHDESRSILTPSLANSDKLPRTKPHSFRESKTGTQISSFDVDSSGNFIGDPIEENETRSGEGDVIYGEITSDQQQKTIKAATAEKLVEILASELCYPTYRSCFLTVFRTFMTPNDLISILRFQYRLTKEKRDVVRVIGVVKKWIEEYGTLDFEHGTETRVALESMIQELSEIVPVGGEQLSKALDKMGTKKHKTEGIKRIERSKANLPDLDNVGSWTPEQIRIFAEQVTCLLSEKFCKITGADLFMWCMGEKSKISTVKKQSSMLFDWTLWAICRKSKWEDLQAVLDFFTNLVFQFMELNNFDSAKEVLNAMFDNHILQMLKLGSAQIQKTSNLEKIRKIFQADGAAHVNYCKHLESLRSPCVPWLGYHLRMLKVSTREMPSKLNDLIHFEKWMKIYLDIEQLQRYQLINHQLTPVEGFEEYLRGYEFPDRLKVYEWLQIINQQKEDEAIMNEFLERNTKWTEQVTNLRAELGLFDEMDGEKKEEEKEGKDSSKEGSVKPTKKEEDDEGEEAQQNIALSAMAMEPIPEQKEKVSKHMMLQAELTQTILKAVDECLVEESSEECLRARMDSLKSLIGNWNQQLAAQLEENEAIITRYEKELEQK